MADPKYAALPGIAVDQPDVFETCELPEADQHHDFDVRHLKVITDLYLGLLDTNSFILD